MYTPLSNFSTAYSDVISLSPHYGFAPLSAYDLLEARNQFFFNGRRKRWRKRSDVSVAIAGFRFS